jgi:glutamate transport system substrate-binding protein
MHSYKTIGFIALAALVVTLSACGTDGSGGSTGATSGDTPTSGVFAAGTTMERLNKARKITIGTKHDLPLFGFQGLSGQPEGFDVEIGKIIASELGIPQTGITWVETLPIAREEALEKKRVDVIVATYTINDVRKQRVTFAGPYYSGGQDLMVKSDNKTITGPESLKASGAKVCALPGTAPAEEILDYIARSRLVLLDTYSDCADALSTGKVDAVTSGDAILLGLVSDSRGTFKLVNKLFTRDTWGIGVPKGDVAFCEFVNGVLTKADKDGRYGMAWAQTAGGASGTAIKLPELERCG